MFMVAPDNPAAFGVPRLDDEPPPATERLITLPHAVDHAPARW